MILISKEYQIEKEKYMPYVMISWCRKMVKFRKALP